jgi:hypothetical protein
VTKIVALGPEPEDCNRARVRVMPAVPVKVVVAVKAALEVAANVDHARL